MPKIVFINKRNYYVIYLNDLIHLLIKKADFIGVQSFKEPASKEEQSVRGFNAYKYSIIYYFRSTSITCEYDTIEKWQAILKLINEYIK